MMEMELLLKVVAAVLLLGASAAVLVTAWAIGTAEDPEVTAPTARTPRLPAAELDRAA